VFNVKKLDRINDEQNSVFFLKRFEIVYAQGRNSIENLRNKRRALYLIERYEWK